MTEIGMQRRKTKNGKLLHCCCICGVVEPWGRTWSWFGSYKEEDDGSPLAKFCSDLCRGKSGLSCQNVTDAMKKSAREKEWRYPKPYISPPRNYSDAISDQNRKEST